MNFSVSAESSPISATAWVWGWQTMTWPGLAFDRRPVHSSSVVCRSAASSTWPLTVNTGPASGRSGKSGRISGGRTKLRRPRPRMMSFSTPV